MIAIPKFAPVRQDAILLDGGLDTDSPPLLVPTGYCRQAQNFEIAINGGYRRIDGFERYDGQPSPSAALYSILPATITGNYAVGDTLTGATSGATGIICAIPASPITYFVITKLTGAFQANENLEDAAVVIAVATASQQVGGASTPLLDAQYTLAAANIYRGSIQPVPGSGPVLGAWLYEDTVYAVRNNAGGTAAVLWASSAAGWTAVPLYNELAFTGGSGAAPAEGSAITQGTVSAVVKRVVLSNGDWAQTTSLILNGTTTNASPVVSQIDTTDLYPGMAVSGTGIGASAVIDSVDSPTSVTLSVNSTATGSVPLTFVAGAAEGRIIIANPTGGNFAAGAFTFAGGSATASAAQTAIALLPGGKYNIIIANFAGTLATRRVYGADGVNRAFEFDGLVYVPITTGTSPDTPTLPYAFKNQLFLAFDSALENSAIGQPYVWKALEGAAEMDLGDTITDMIGQPGTMAGGALAIYTRYSIQMLYGSSQADWSLVAYAGDNEQGGLARSAQRIVGNTLVFDDRGISVMAATLIYGNFEAATVTSRVQSLVQSLRNKFVCSTLQRDKNQYRVFFSDGSALFLTFNGKNIRGIMPVLYPVTLTCVHDWQWDDGNEAIFFGATDGYVYQMDKGINFDGQPIEAYFTLNWDSSKSIRQLKRYLRAWFEIEGDGYSEFNFGYTLGYGAGGTAQPGMQLDVLGLGAPLWDSGVNWDSSATWDGVALTAQTLQMNGSAENVSITVGNNGAYFSPLTFSSAVMQYLPRRLLRS